MPIIKNYGFLWDRGEIFRGAGSNAGHLKGESPGYPTADFRDQIGVYVLYDSNQGIIYVGQAGNGNATLFGRLKAHMSGRMHNRWKYFSWVGFKDVNANGSLSAQQNIDAGVSGFRYSDALNEIEGILIEIVEPKLNKQSGKLKTARRYYQHIDERLAETTNGDLMLELQQIKKKLGQR